MNGTTLARRIEDRLFERLQQRCWHDPHVVTADLFSEGFGDDKENVQWCLRCGAARLAYTYQGEYKLTDWHEPRATWSWFRLGRGDCLRGSVVPRRLRRWLVLLPDSCFRRTP